MTLNYDTEECNVFVRDMESAGYKPRHYRGRFHWTGPAVEVADLQERIDVTGLTDVALQWDQLGKGYIVCAPACNFDPHLGVIGVQF